MFDACLDTEANYFGIGVDTINNGIIINNKNFNVDHFIILIDAMDILDKNILHEESFLNIIKRYAFLYGLDVEQLKDAVKLSVNVDKSINYDELEIQVKRLYDNRMEKRRLYLWRSGSAILCFYESFEMISAFSALA